MVASFRQKLQRAKQLAYSFLGVSSAPETAGQDAAGSSRAADAETLPPTDDAMKRVAPEDTEADSRQSQSSLKRPTPHGEDDGGGEWQVVTRPSKKPKKVPRPGKSYPALTFSPNARLHSKVSLNQLRDLVTYIFADGTGPQWINVSHRPQFRKIVAIMVPGLEEAMFKANVNYLTYNDTAARDEPRALTAPDGDYPRKLEKEGLPEALQPFADMFPHLWPIRTPGDEKQAKMHSPVAAFLTTPLPKEKTLQKGGVKPATEPHGWKNERTRITEFLASADELAENGFVVHPVLLTEGAREKFVTPEGWVMTNVDKLEDGDVPESEIQDGSVTAGRDILGLDCEMCMTGENEFSLTRVSVVDWDGKILVDEFVKPDKPITDYVTKYSGITEAMLKDVKTTLRDIQQKLLKILHPRTILVGHSLESDTKAMQLSHPFIVDTSLLYPHPRGPPLKSSLKFLASKYLVRTIQNSDTAGHDSIEDAKTCLDLVKQKCEKGRLWGTSDSNGENLFRRLARAGTTYKAQGGDAALGGIEAGKTSAAVDWGQPCKGMGAGATYQLGCESDEEVATSVIRAVQGDADGREIRSGGVDFIWARMRELETLQGWWNNNRAENRNSDGGPPKQDAAEEELAPGDSETSPLERALVKLSDRLTRIHDALPPCTGFIVFSGSGDPREMARLQQMQSRWRKEYNTPGKKWDDLSVQWTDRENQLLRQAVQRARSGIGFLTVK
ncbi:exonuclease [Tolypocladium capitatum]|uniref:Exonuclease n=1 Tax=Tolypocladium capitatum TaxID=45235 RepID=A0A2K3QBD4_9HYPO|nr:exonuclease [Tolypocladium capitatum]